MIRTSIALLSLGLSLTLVSCGARQSAATESKAVQLEVAVSNTRVMADAEGQVVARIRLSTQDAPPVQRPPVNLVLAMDTSASMRGEAMARAREAAATAVKSLADGDRLAVIAFHSTAEAVFESTELDGDARREALERIAAMEAIGTTDMGGGLAKAIEQLDHGRKKVGDGGINRVVLLSDGVPNDPSQVLSYAASVRNYGATITALGLGLDYDEVLLGQVAQASGGSLHYIESPTEVAAVFQSEILQIHRVIAQNVQLGLVFGPGVTPVAVHGHPGAVRGRGASISLGQMGAGEVRDVFVALRAPARSDRATIELLDAVLLFNDVAADNERITKRAFLALEATSDDKRIGPGRNLELELEAARAEAAAATVQAIALARANQLDQARSMLDDAEKRARELAQEHGEDGQLVELADAMVSTRQALPTYVTVVQQGGSVPPPSPVAGTSDSLETESMRRVKRSYDKATTTLQSR